MKIDDFLQIEKKYDLYHLEIEGVQPWMYFRTEFWNGQVCGTLLDLGKSAQKRNMIKRCKDQILSSAKLILQNNRKQICKADIIFCSHARRVKNRGYFECIYTGKLSQKYRNSIVIEEPWQNQHLQPVQEKNIYYTDLLRMKEIFCYQMHYRMRTGKYKKIYTEIQDKFSGVLAEIANAYGYEMPYRKVYEELTQLVIKVQVLRCEFRKLLNKIQPKLIVEVVYFNKRCMILNELAKERSIPTVELQHGSLISLHAAYRFADGCGDILQFPNYVFMFSEYWKKKSNYPIDDKQIKVTGYPYFERQLKKYRKADTHTGDVTNIIFVSQGTIGMHLSQLASDVCELLEGEKYHIIYKLHPGEYIGWEKRYPWLLKDNIEVVDSQKHSIYECFSKADIQVGVYSTAIYEGMGFGLATYIYDVAYADEMNGLCEQGYAVKVRDAGELYSNIVSLQHQDNGNKNFWQMNAFENICRELDTLLEKNK